jgi:hypothetical protein
MAAFDASALLDTWERSFALSPPRRALALLAYAHPEHGTDVLNALTLGQRNAELARLRMALFGRTLDLVAQCPQCSTALELALDAQAFAAADAPSSAPPIDCDGTLVQVRAATAGDLVDLPGEAELAQRTLAQRCIVVANGQGIAPELSDAALAAIGDALAQADPAATSELVLDCPDCATRWAAAFDIAALLWREIDAWARRTLRDVHALASAYAWTEREVLALSPTRRRLYRELCGP